MIKVKTIQSGSGGNAYLVSDPQTTLLLEAGTSYKNIIKNKDGKIDAVLVSHKHDDHSKSLPELALRRTPIYTHKEVASYKNITKYTEIEPLKSYEIKTFVVKPFELVHDVYNLGFLIYSKITKEKLLFIIDTMYVENKFKGIDYLMIECNHSVDKLMPNTKYPAFVKSRIRQAHMNLEDVEHFLDSNNLESLKKIYLIHRSKENSDDKVIEDTIKKKTKAEVILC